MGTEKLESIDRIRKCPVSQHSGMNDLSHESVPINAPPLLEICGGSVALACELLDELEATGFQYVERIHKSVSERDMVATADASHSLKGVAGILCAEEIRKLADEIELAGRSSDSNRIEFHVSQLAAEMQRCVDYLPELRLELAEG